METEVKEFRQIINTDKRIYHDLRIICHSFSSEKLSRRKYKKRLYLKSSMN